MSQVLSEIRTRMRRATCADEEVLVRQLIDDSLLPETSRETVREQAIGLVQRCRAQSHRAGTLDSFLQEFGLSNDEGIALMCLAEALLRVPDEETANRLIAEKIQSGDWGAHKGKSASRFVNASVWGLMLTGRIVRLEGDITQDTASWVQRLVSSLGEPVVRQAVLQAMRIMGGQYVLGRTIGEGIRKGAAQNLPGTRFSFDMLGEGARTEQDAQRYFTAYADAITAIGNAETPSSVIAANGISIKLSALHPRYEFRQKRRVIDELLPRVRDLALLARQYKLGFSIDAEECDRLELSLDVFEALAQDSALAGWDGLGFVLQAYQRRAAMVCEWLIGLAKETGHRFMVRLVKGAYWDGEIKRAQEQGLESYPVFTRKSHTDLSYQCCAELLLAAPQRIYPQFATHNAHTVALVQELAGRKGSYEFQRLHGMGQLLYEQVKVDSPELPVRIYAPIGNHRDLLPYLVRRLLENGANSSFVNRFLDAAVAPQDLLCDPISDALEKGCSPHPGIPAPVALYALESRPWRNSRGIDLHDPLLVAAVLPRITDWQGGDLWARPIVNGKPVDGEAVPVHNPANTEELLGHFVEALPEVIDEALTAAVGAQKQWDFAGAEFRAECLERMAELLEQHCYDLMGLIVREAGRTIEDALSEVREAVDFCRYYASQARALFAGPAALPGPTGELNELSLHGRGAFLCISPWNFPLAIFTGQVSAALVAGNSVIAKPAEQTPLIAARTVELFLDAGIPPGVLHYLPGDGARVGGHLVADPRVAGVAFTGSTTTARIINRQLAERDGPIAPFIAETGGLNVMLVDATALPEQVVDDVISSAFHSAGQRCSALRVLYLQEEVADGILQMLAGAMQELQVGNPSAFATDIGPVIDGEAQRILQAHEHRMLSQARLVARCETGPDCQKGTFIAPQVYEIDQLSQLESEIFGPILHVIRYSVQELPAIIDDINASGYGLTLGVHSRIDGFARDVFTRTNVGNTYINRNMVGAVVGVNPFGGQGLSGTGPKAGGPHYLLRFATERTRTDNVVARGGNTQLFNLTEDSR